MDKYISRKISLALVCLLVFLQTFSTTIPNVAAAQPKVKYKAVSAGYRMTAALTTEGTVHVWGDNSSGQCNVPKGLKNVKAIDALDHNVVALKEDGTVVVWGYNDYGQCNVPKDLSGVKSVAVGDNFVIALKNDGTVIAWGDNSMGQCNVPAGLSGIVAIDAGYNHSLALKRDGTVIAWGDNEYGQCNIPTDLKNIKQVAAGGLHSSALDYDGNVISWGNNYYMQCYTDVWYLWYTSNFRQKLKIKYINAGAEHTIAISDKNYIFCSGVAMNFSNGVEGTSISIDDNVDGAVAAAVGEKHAIILKNDGTFKIYGSYVGNSPFWYSYNGELVMPELLNNVKDISFPGVGYNVSLNDDGTAVLWNERNDKLPLLSDIKDIASGNNVFFLKKDGCVYYLIKSYSYEIIKAPPELSDVKAISAIKNINAYDCLAAIKNDGTMLLYNTSYNTSNWKRIKLPDDLSNVKAVEIISNRIIMVLKNDGTVVLVCDGEYKDDIIASNLSNVISIDAIKDKYAALLNDGTVIVWGDNFYHKFEKIPDAVDIDIEDNTYGYQFLTVLKSDGSVLKAVIKNISNINNQQPFIYTQFYKRDVKLIQDGVAVMNDGSIEGYRYLFFIPSIKSNQSDPDQNSSQPTGTKLPSTTQTNTTPSITNQTQYTPPPANITTPVFTTNTQAEIPALSPTPLAPATVTPVPTSLYSGKTTEEPSVKKPSANMFKDLTGHWAEQYMMDLVQKGVISGYSDGTVKPDAIISRAEFVKIIVKTLGYSSSQNAKINFVDYSQIPEWAKEFFNTAAEKGIINGFEDNTIRPFNNCTRQEIIVMIMKAFSLGQSERSLEYNDASKVAKWAYKYVSKSIEAGIVTGYKDNTLKPLNNVTRAEAVTMIARCLKLKNN
jgi:alpha-tubulin suppressor-like RCC1 family protein